MKTTLYAILIQYFIYMTQFITKKILKLNVLNSPKHVEAIPIKMKNIKNHNYNRFIIC